MSRVAAGTKIAPLVAALALAACSAAETASSVAATPPPQQQNVAVQVTPGSASVQTGRTQAFAAAVTGTADTSVTWSVTEGSTGGSVTSAGLYTAPGAAGTFHVVATSNADPTKSASSTVTVTTVAPPPVVTVSVSPTSPALDTCKTLTFTATVTGSSNTGVTWSVQEGATGGSITTAGIYTAPSTDGTYHVVATSKADTTKSASVPVAVATRVLSVGVSPATISVPTGGTATFTATVTTSCGAFAALKTIDSNGVITGN